MKYLAVGAVVFLVGSFVPAQAALDAPIKEPEEVTLSYAKMGDPVAQVKMALLCEDRNTPKDKEAAITWYKLAAAAGNPVAQFNLAVHLSNGDILPKNENEAARWFYAAARQGMFEAQLALIECYGQGRGLMKDPVQALLWDFRARRSLQLQTEAEAGEPPKPGKLRADGFVEFINKKGERQAISADGSLESTNADGTKSIKRADGGNTEISQTGERVTKYPDGGELIEYPDGRSVAKDRHGTIERKFLDGTRELEGEGTSSSGKKVRVVEKFDKSGAKISQRIIDGVQTVVKMADGSMELETTGTDQENNKVRVIERFDGDKVVHRQVIREDGVERKEGEIWIIRRWIHTADGRMAKLKEQYGPGLALEDCEQKVVATSEREDDPDAPSKTPRPSTPRPMALIPVRTPPPTISEPPPPIMSGMEGFIVKPPSMKDAVGALEAQLTRPPPSRPKVSIARQLEALEKVEHKVRYFAGATGADVERLRRESQTFVPNLIVTPQKPGTANWLTARVDKITAPPIPPPLVPLSSDRSDQHPLGYHGRFVIKSLKWKHAETEHFVVHYMEESDATPVVQNIECAWFAVTQVLRIDTSKAERKSHVFIYPDLEAWKTFVTSLGMPETVAGFAYKDELLLGAPDNREAYLKTLCHETAHAVVSYFYPGRKWPLWLNEGFADYMALKTLALRSQKPLVLTRDAGTVDIEDVFGRDRYGNMTTPAGAAAVARFYAQSEKCVSILLTNLQPEGFAKFANLAFAGNSMAFCLRSAGNADIDTPEKFQAMVNKY